MNLRSTHLRLTVPLIAVAAVAAPLAVAGSVGTDSGKQRIAIEEKSTLGAPSGTFRLIPLTGGPLKADSGTFTFSATQTPTVVRDGQTVTTYRAVDTLKGKLGTLKIPSVSNVSAAGGGFFALGGPWSVGSGSGAYAGLRGGGRGSGVGTPKGVALTRYEGYLVAP